MNISEESIYFFTFHKCASTLFGSFLLRNLDGLQHVDYAAYLWDKPSSFYENLEFNKYGYAYGPIRLSAREKLVNELLIEPTTRADFLSDKRAIGFIRDPRDILVSAYYSFGFNHPLNSIPERREEQLKLRNEIQSLSIDDYAIKYSEQQLKDFNLLDSILSKCQKKILLRYEDMVENFDVFIQELKTMVDFSDEVSQTLFEKSRPKEKIDAKSHKRSGKTKGFLNELKPHTIDKINGVLGDVLKKHNYDF